MIRTKIDVQGLKLIDRERAARIASTASRFPCTLTLECDRSILNLKSMIGLLSQIIPKNGQMDLVADGPQEDAATQAMRDVLIR